ncbi:type III-B CRISPR module-associated protein Cmr5 [Thiococcus pfennigii]|uniref:type III-B CRISPR module-associated protein Cmr5 n=1 Tax=Thiococcus pfennigii TaxID=1057 RepID=UPI00190713BB|nr:type III-B CRISPR module-associated protein Cmr5 [Thiococcus pfennigii]
MANDTQQTDMPSRRQTVEQQRAKFAWEEVDKVTTSLRASYLSTIRSAPAMVINNGLGATLAFQLSKGGAQKVLYEQLERWLCDQNRPALPAQDAAHVGDNRLVRRLLAANSARYRRVTDETLEMVKWLKRFAEANIDGGGAHG